MADTTDEHPAAAVPPRPPELGGRPPCGTRSPPGCKERAARSRRVRAGRVAADVTKSSPSAVGGTCRSADDGSALVWERLPEPGIPTEAQTRFLTTAPDGSVYLMLLGPWGAGIYRTLRPA